MALEQTQLMAQQPVAAPPSALPRTVKAAESSRNFRHMTTLLGDANHYRSPADHALALFLPEVQIAIFAFYRHQDRRLWRLIGASDLTILDTWLEKRIALIERKWDTVHAQFASSKEAAQQLHDAIGALPENPAVQAIAARIAGTASRHGRSW